ncbi:MAG: tRNA pseudouridine(55) synthase TruB [Phycisphaeraceae bacterium]|nr:tRNA pseudouridine(55) synthase TruB [Phycisphaeraceae bacterium]
MAMLTGTSSAEIPSGFLVVDKPLGWSSMDVIRRAREALVRGLGRRRWNQKGLPRIRVGHAGTLDPLATGVLVVCFGGATRLVERLMGLVKVYRARIDLSAFTATDDREGARQEIDVQAPPTLEAVDAALDGMIGAIRQRPPAFSAVHVDGKRAYQLARQGQEVQTVEKTVYVDRIERLVYAWPHLEIRVTCGRGTYIRSIARDLGIKLETGGHLAALQRESVGPFTLDIAVRASRLEEPLTANDLLPVGEFAPPDQDPDD